MWRTRSINLAFLIVVLAVILIVKFLYLDQKAQQDLVLDPRPLQVETVIERTSPLSASATPTPVASKTVAIALSGDEIAQLQKEDEDHVKFLSEAFPAGQFVRRKNLSNASYAEFFSLPDGGEIVKISQGDRLVNESWKAANGDSVERAFTAAGRVYALSVRNKNYSFTNFYDANMQVSKKVELVNGELVCINYDQVAPVTREPGACKDDDFREFEDQRDIDDSP